MSQTVKAYTVALWRMQKSVALQVAQTDIRCLPLQLRAVLLMADVAVALVIQALVDAGTFTDAQVQTRLNNVANGTYNPINFTAAAPDPETGYQPPDPDMGA